MARERGQEENDTESTQSAQNKVGERREEDVNKKTKITFAPRPGSRWKRRLISKLNKQKWHKHLIKQNDFLKALLYYALDPGNINTRNLGYSFSWKDFTI